MQFEDNAEETSRDKTQRPVSDGLKETFNMAGHAGLFSL